MIKLGIWSKLVMSLFDYAKCNWNYHHVTGFIKKTKQLITINMFLLTHLILHFLFKLHFTGNTSMIQINNGMKM